MTTLSTQFPPRLDEEQPSKSYQIIKIAKELGIKVSDYVYSSDFSHKLAFKQSDIMEGIDNYKKRYAKPESFYSWPNQLDKFLKTKHNVKKLDEAIRYLKKAKETYIPFAKVISLFLKNLGIPKRQKKAVLKTNGYFLLAFGIFSTFIVVE